MADQPRRELPDDKPGLTGREWGAMVLIAVIAVAVVVILALIWSPVLWMMALWPTG